MSENPGIEPNAHSREVGGFADAYDEEITKLSFRELQNLAKWTNGHGLEVYLIGGWAAWRYHAGLGSRDVDVVFPDARIKDRFFGMFCPANHFAKVALLGLDRFRKSVATPRREEWIDIDALSMEDRFPFHEDHGKDIPFRLLPERHRSWDLGGAMVRIPEPELLMMMKIKAFRDRRWDLERKGLAPIESQYLRGKIWKDEQDIRGIFPHVLDTAAFWDIAEQQSVRPMVENALAELGLILR